MKDENNVVYGLLSSQKYVNQRKVILWKRQQIFLLSIQSSNFDDLFLYEELEKTKKATINPFSNKREEGRMRF